MIARAAHPFDDAALSGAEGPAPSAARPRPAGRGWAVAAVGILAGFIVFGFLADALAPAPSGPASSSYATSPAGVAAWAELLQRGGHPVAQLRQELGLATLSPGSTLVVLGAGTLTGAEARNVDGFVRAGGRLVLDATSPGRVLPALITDPPGWTHVSSRLFVALARVPETSGVATVRTAGDGAWVGSSRARPLGDRTGGALLLVRTLGKGQIDLLADPSPLQNRLLATADNARFALNLAGAPGRPVVFAEALHGFGAATGIAALPGTFWFVFVGLCVAGGAWALARGRRLGPSEPPAEVGQPPRSAYVEALARALTGTGDAGGMAGVIRVRIGDELTRRHANRAGGIEAPRRETLAEDGLSEREVDLVLARGSSDDGETELVVLGRVLARLRSGEERASSAVRDPAAAVER